MKSHQLVFPRQQEPEALKQVNYQVKELLTLKNISHYHATILESSCR